jgi:hypothetical protein
MMMTISGFTMVKNAGKLYYPFKESLLSILPIVDEMVIALGDCDADDTTRQMIDDINSPKIKVVQTVWDTKAYPYGSELAHQTDIAKAHCKGDWLFYLQADEVVHEQDHQIILSRCREFLSNQNVEGLLFKYIHFWGDYEHAFTHDHCWYRHEMRIIRNRPEIHSWRDAQSFRIIPHFTKEKYLSKEGTSKLKVAMIDACIYHYGWVRPPLLMARKQQRFESCYSGNQLTAEEVDLSKVIDYGMMKYVPLFRGSHPQVMVSRIAAFDWGSQLNYSSKPVPGSKAQKHVRLKYRILTWIESIISPKHGLFTFKNYILVQN